MQRRNEISELIQENDFLNMLSKIDLENDTKLLLREADLQNKEGIVTTLINYLLENKNKKILENNIQYIPPYNWKEYSNNEEFKELFIEKFDVILREQERFYFQNIKYIIDKDKEEDFYTNNITKLIDIPHLGIEYLIEHLIKKTTFGKDLLIQNQNYLFSKIKDVNYVLITLKNMDIDTGIFIDGIMANFEKIVKKDTNSLKLFLKVLNKIVKESELDEEKIQIINKKVQDTIVRDGKLDSQLEESIATKSDVESIQAIREFGIEKEVLKKSQEMFINTFENEQFIKYIEDCRKYEGLPENYTIRDYIKTIFKSDKFLVNNLHTDERTLYIIERLITEVAEIQEVNPLDTDFLGSGAYSRNFKIGEFVLKIGFQRGTRKIPYHKRILAPIIRQETNRNDPELNPNICVELQNLGDPDWYKEMNDNEIEEKLYKIYSDLRKDDIYWLDIKPDNVVRLLKPNAVNLKIDGKEIGRNEESVDMINIKNEEVLGIGELVIADTDYIYSKEDAIDINDRKVNPITYDLFIKFTKRYNKENNYKTNEYEEFERLD